GTGGRFCGRGATRRSGGQPAGHPPLLSCPSWARTRTLLIPCHFGFRRRSTSVRGLDCAFTFALTRSGGSRPVSTPSPLGAWLGVASQGFADFESIHARRFRRGVQRAHRQVPLESGVFPVTPRGSITPVRLLASQARDHFTLKLAVGQLRIASKGEPWSPTLIAMNYLPCNT